MLWVENRSPFLWLTPSQSPTNVALGWLVMIRFCLPHPSHVVDIVEPSVCGLETQRRFLPRYRRHPSSEQLRRPFQESQHAARREQSAAKQQHRTGFGSWDKLATGDLTVQMAIRPKHRLQVCLAAKPDSHIDQPRLQYTRE